MSFTSDNSLELYFLVDVSFAGTGVIFFFFQEFENANQDILGLSRLHEGLFVSMSRIDVLLDPAEFETRE